MVSLETSQIKQNTERFFHQYGFFEKSIKSPLPYIGDTLSSGSNPEKEFSKSATINLLYYRVYKRELS